MKGKRFLLAAMSVALFGCSGQTSAPTNLAPSIVGTKDVRCVVDGTIDFLDGVAALDREDGDITPEMEITVFPSVEVVDGYATFSRVGEYTVTYSVADSSGRTAQKTTSVSVVARENYTYFKMPYGYYGETNGGASFDTCGMVDGEFTVKAKGGSVAEDVMISRDFALATGVQYTFNLHVESKTSGRVKALADGVECGEMRMKEGENDLSFSHCVFDAENDSRNVRISLCFGALDDKVDLIIRKISVDFPQNEGEIVDRTKNYTFTGYITPRIEEGCEGEVKTEDGGKTAVLRITNPIEKIWLGGMFVNTGVALKRGVTYTVSFDLEREQEKNYEVFVQCNQWNEKKFENASIYNPENGRYSKDITVEDEDHVGALWLYVQSGTEANVIRMRNLKVEEHLSAVGHDDFPLRDYENSCADAYPCQLRSNLGDYRYFIPNFSSSDGDMQVISQPFYVKGSGGNYVLSFKAKATAPIEVVVVAPISGGWDPTILWSRIVLTEEMRTYTFFMNASGADRDYVLRWQYGSPNNQKYHDVMVDVSDVAISLRNAELDG